MKSIAIFNNKGGVGKTTLTFHVAYALAEMGHNTLLLDLDPQSNLTLFAVSEEELHAIWEGEDDFVDDFERAKTSMGSGFDTFAKQTHTTHFALKPTEDGTGETSILPSPIRVASRLRLLPGRLSLHMFEDKIATLWSQAFLGDPLAIRTLTRVRRLCLEYAKKYGFEYVLIDTSPSLGILNKILISTADAFLVPCTPDMFSLYGIRNIGKALGKWKTEFDTMYSLLSDAKREYFPFNFVRCLGFTIYNAKKYSGTANPWNLAIAHYNYAQQIPPTINEFLPPEVLSSLPDEKRSVPIGETAVMHSHTTLAAMAQKYRTAIWRVPSIDLETGDRGTIMGNRSRYEETQNGYHRFAKDLLERMQALE